MAEWLRDAFLALWKRRCWHLWHKQDGLLHEVGDKFVGASYNKRCLKCGQMRRDYWMPL